MVEMLARDVAPSDYVKPFKCNGWHRVQKVDSESLPGADQRRLWVSPSHFWWTRSNSSVSVAFSGVDFCTLDHS